jgi:type VI secretion system protein ImpG
MDPRFLQYYNRELGYMRELGGEFAREFPKIAGRLGLDAFECADPYVERLLEGVAFLAARVQLKIDSEFPRFTEHLLDVVYPHYLAPTPSMAVVQVQPQKQSVLTEGFDIPRGTALRSSQGKGERSGCEYRTAHDIRLWPVEIVSATHSAYFGDIGELRLPGARKIRGVLRLRLRTWGGVPFNQLTMDALPVFIRSHDQMASRLYELLVAGAVATVVRHPDGTVNEVVEGQSLRPLGFDDAESLLPYGPRSFQGYRLLHEYFAFPSRYLFVELSGLGEALRATRGQEIEIAIMLDRHDPLVEGGIGADHFALFCSPAVNLFPRNADRIHLSDRFYEYHVVPDRTRPTELEVHSITKVSGLGTGLEVQREFRPFHASTRGSTDAASSSYFTVHRRLRGQNSKRGPAVRSTYVGSEVFISLVDGSDGAYHPQLRQLAVEALCTNRDLPSFMSVGQGKSDFHLESGAPIESVRCVAGPSSPRPSNAWGDMSWKLINHLSLNYLSLVDDDHGNGEGALKEMLHLYGDLTEPAIRRQIEGIRSAKSAPVVRRIPGEGPPTFGRGLEITLLCDEAAFEGTSVFLLGSVLEHFFTRYVSLNSFTEMVLKTLQRGEIIRWPARMGRRSTI